jgi:hypothetical protein
VLRLLVCGGRDFNDMAAAFPVIDRLHATDGISCIIQGGASGADYIAARWAFMRDVLAEEYCADWNKYGRAAGPIRNGQMITEGKPDLVLAFPGGRGTQDMKRRAIAAGIRVIDALG